MVLWSGYIAGTGSWCLLSWLVPVRFYFRLEVVVRWAGTGIVMRGMLCYAMLCYVILCYAMLCYAMLCHDIVSYAVLMLCYCYAMLC